MSAFRSSLPAADANVTIQSSCDTIPLSGTSADEMSVDLLAVAPDLDGIFEPNKRVACRSVGEFTITA